MRRRTLPRNAIAALALLSCTAAAADAPALPSLPQVQALMDQWTLPDQRDVPMPAPSVEQAQALLRARFAVLATQQTDAGERSAYEQAARITQVHAVRNCDLGREAAVFECTVRAGDGTHQGEQTVAFIRVDGQWQEAPTR